jgi:hypothetical protein
VRCLQQILERLCGKAAIDALRAGDATTVVDAALWAPAWEGARNFRHHFLLDLARRTRDAWREDSKVITSTMPAFLHATHTQQALHDRLSICVAFAFRYLPPRMVCFLSDALMLALERDMDTTQAIEAMAIAAARCSRSSKPLLDALTMGASGSYRFQPERVIASNTAHQAA